MLAPNDVPFRELQDFERLHVLAGGEGETRGKNCDLEPVWLEYPLSLDVDGVGWEHMQDPKVASPRQRTRSDVRMGWSFQQYKNALLQPSGVSLVMAIHPD